MSAADQTRAAKYELTNETCSGLRRIRALRDIPRFNVLAGDLGGWVKSGVNLSQHGDAWVSGDARVYGDALVYGNALVYGDALVSGDAWVSGDARVYGDALVSGDALVYGNARVYSLSTCLAITGLPSGHVTLTPSVTRTPLLRIGCWHGTPAELRDLIAGTDWPEARGAEQDARRPGLAALADLADVVVASWGDPADWPIEGAEALPEVKP